MEYCYRIEYQKHGLPHFYLLLFLHKDNHFLNPATIDEIICSKLPSQEAHLELHGIITAAMVHGPCSDEKLECRCMSRC
jgi:hypothetical protein